jgi:hypothetical protein
VALAKKKVKDCLKFLKPPNLRNSFLFCQPGFKEFNVPPKGRLWGGKVNATTKHKADEALTEVKKKILILIF